jgi:hypothetical protein
VFRITRFGGIVTGGRVQGALAVARAFGDIGFKDEDTLYEKYLTCMPGFNLSELI